MTDCQTCKGKKTLRVLKDSDTEIDELPCPTCRGSGSITEIAGINVDPIINKAEELMDLFGLKRLDNDNTK